MGKTPSFSLQPHLRLNLKQNQLLMVCPQMQQALYLLQLPILELAAFIQTQLETNCLFDLAEEESEEELEEWQESSSKEGSSLIENSVAFAPTPFEELLQETQGLFDAPCEKQIAAYLLASLDERGYLTTPLEEIASFCKVCRQSVEKVLAQIQTLYPALGARCVQEAFLLQLAYQKKGSSLAYQIVKNSFNDLLHNRLPHIAAQQGCSLEQVCQAIDQDLKSLHLHPLFAWRSTHPQHIVPDATLIEEGTALRIEINEEPLPEFRLNPKYLRMLEDPSLPLEAKEYLKDRLACGKWMARNLHERHATLYRIIEAVIKRQGQFLCHLEGRLKPMTMKEISRDLGCAESTVARTVAHKFIATPRGMLALRSLFTNSYSTSQGTLSSHTVKQILFELLHQEDKRRPLSDEELSQAIQNKGVACARRTVAKYRQQLCVGTAAQRRLFS